MATICYCECKAVWYSQFFWKTVYQSFIQEFSLHGVVRQKEYVWKIIFQNATPKSSLKADLSNCLIKSKHSPHIWRRNHMESFILETSLTKQLFTSMDSDLVPNGRWINRVTKGRWNTTFPSSGSHDNVKKQQLNVFSLLGRFDRVIESNKGFILYF